MTADPNDSAPAREHSGEDTQKIPVPDDGGTPPGEGQIPAHEPQDEPADSDTEAPDEERGN